jgi:hypothetical protein
VAGLSLARAAATETVSAPTPTQRALLVFHEGRESVASVALLLVAEELRERGWTLDGVFTGGGTLVADACCGLASVEVLERPPAVRLANWRRPSDAVATLRSVQSYLRGFVRVLRERNPHVIHCNTLASLPEARIARAFGFPVVIAIPSRADATLVDGRQHTSVIQAATVELAYQVALQSRFAPRSMRTRDARD